MVVGRFGKSINQLRDFTLAVESGEQFSNMRFPDDELGEIGGKIAENYRQMKEQKKEIVLEREKLLQHVHSAGEGICFFSAGNKVEFYNGLFIQYLNTIIEEVCMDPAVLLTKPVFDKVKTFLDNPEDGHYFETPVYRQGKHFMLRVNRFGDDGFEFIINDITQQEKMRRMKQEMTGNIAHELRTPITGIRGYLETVLEQPLDTEKQQYFIHKAYNQTLLLSELIQDMGLITKIEDAPHTFSVEPVEIKTVIADVCTDLEKNLQEKNITVNSGILDDVMIDGNRHLLYSIFRNLTENVIRYAGTGVAITINKYNEDKDFYYFSYADTGVGVSDEQHLVRLFERFYRVNEGRTRETGGSGLGLSIVKNAVLFHKGAIIAKNHAGGGLEVLFSLAK
jgi:signal transduction histidine kinase